MPSETPQPRNTKQRTAIREAIDASDRPLGPQELLEIGRRDVPSMSLATVYRNINALLDEGSIAKVELPGQPPLYESAGLHHHHHFHCDGCGRVFDIDGCPGNLQPLLPKGFTLNGHEITLYGRCSDCGPSAKP